MDAAALENLAYDLLKKPFTDEDKAKIVSRIQEINLARNQEITGQTKPTSSTRASQEQK